ncbi:MAG TPA: damage-inducible mutagenesis protein, partial [Rhodospirillaceae bacterium]|nr:damage-inducible mutagenesis protein [Rhodospirillaceae bacterium]
GPGLVQAGHGDLPDRLIIARARNGSEGCWIVEEALRSEAFAAVVLDPADPVGLIPSRRLHLAAGRGGALGLILREGQGHGAVLAPGIAATRWQVDPVPSIRKAATIHPHWNLVLQRQRGGSGDRSGGERCWSVPA